MDNKLYNDWFEQQVCDSPSEISEELKQKMFTRIQAKIEEEEKSNKTVSIYFRKWRYIAAAILLPAIIALGGYYFYSNASNTNTGAPLLIAAGRGEKANITLPDGSKVWLNSDSKLTYANDYNKNRRQLQLDGEAYFEVAHDARKTFTVQCKDLSVEVLGTTFGIKAYAEDSILSTVLVEGKVKIIMPDKTLEMAPNERIVFNRPSRRTYSETVNPNLFTDWRKNRLRFENETLQDIAKTIARIHNIDYAFADESVQDLRFTGSVDNTNIESVLNIITLTAPVSYTVKGSLITFYKNSNKKKYFIE